MIGAYIVTMALALPSYFLAVSLNSPLRDFLVNISATLAGAGFLFFLLNRFFGLDQNNVEHIRNLANKIDLMETKKNLLLQE